VDLVVEAGKAVIGGDDQGDIFRQRVAQATDVVVDLPVELDKLVAVLAVALVVLEQEVVDPVGGHEDAEEQVPVVLLDVVLEGLVLRVDRRVGVLDELGFVVLMAEFRIDVDPVVERLEVVADVIGIGRLVEAG